MSPHRPRLLPPPPPVASAFRIPPSPSAWLRTKRVRGVPCRHTPRTLRDSTRSSTGDPSGKSRMAAASFRHTPHALRGHTGSSNQGPSGKGCLVATASFQHISRPHRGLDSTKGPSGKGHLAAGASFRHTPHTSRSPSGSPTAGPSSTVRMGGGHLRGQGVPRRDRVLLRRLLRRQGEVPGSPSALLESHPPRPTSLYAPPCRGA